MQENFPYRAKVLITQRRYQEAIQICRDGLLANPDHVEGKVLLGMALLALRQYDQVCKEIEPLVAEAPTHALAHRLLGEAHLRLGHTAQARHHLETAKQAQPDSPATLELLEELNRANKSERRRWATPDETITVSGRTTPMLTDDDEELTATAAEISPMVLPKPDESLDFGPPTSQGSPATSSFPDFDDDGDDETIVGDMPSMEEIRKAFPPAFGQATKTSGVEATVRVEAEAEAPPLPPPVLAPSGRRIDLEETRSLDLPEQEGGEAELSPADSSDPDDDDEGSWNDENDQTIATILPEYRDAEPGLGDEGEEPPTGVSPASAGELSQSKPPFPSIPAPGTTVDPTPPGPGSSSWSKQINVTWSVDLSIAGAASSAASDEAGEHDEPPAPRRPPIDDEEPTASIGGSSEPTLGGPPDDDGDDLEPTSLDVPIGMIAASAEAAGESPTSSSASSSPAPAEPSRDGEADKAVDHPSSLDFSFSSEARSEEPLDNQFSVSPSIDQSLAEISSAGIQVVQMLSEGGDEANDSAETRSVDLPDLIPPTADPDATRVLDAASAAIVRASSGARPKKPPAKEAEKRAVSASQLLSFTDDSMRDLEGTDSFSSLAEGTMVDEESLAEVREKLLQARDAARQGVLDRARPVTKDDILDPGSLSLSSIIVGATSPSSKPVDESSVEELSVEDAEMLDDELLEDVEDVGPSSSPLPLSKGLLSAAGRSPRVGLGDFESSKPFRDPALSTALLNQEAGGTFEAGEDEREQRTVAAIPSGSMKPSRGPVDGALGQADRLTKPHRGESSTDSTTSLGSDDLQELSPLPSSPPAPRFIEVTTSPTALAVPAYKPGEGKAGSGAVSVATTSQTKNKPKKTLLGFGPTPPRADPLDEPFDPHEFSRSRVALPEPETSIPLQTGDLMMAGGGSASIDEDDLSTTPPSFPQKKRTLQGMPPSQASHLEEPFRPEDFSSHRIPLPEARSRQGSFDLDDPLRPSDFGRSKRAATIRPLPPVSPLDQPISPDDFTPGPKRKSDLPDPLSEPFWPEDFEDGGKADLRAKAFRFGRTEAPIPPPPPPPPPASRVPSIPPPPPPPSMAMVDEEDLRTHAFGAEPLGPSGYSPPSPPMAPSAPPPPPPASRAPSIPPPPPTPQTRSAIPGSPEFASFGQPPGFAPGPPRRDPSVEMPRPPPDIFDEPPPRKITEPIQKAVRDPLLEPLPSEGRGPQPSHPRPSRRPSPSPHRDPHPDPRRDLRSDPGLKKKKGKGGALKFVVLGVAVLLLLGGLVTGVMLYLNALEVEEQRNQALEQLMRGNYAEYAEAARVYDGLIAAHPDDQTILAEAARVHAMTALEFGTDDDDRAMELIHEAASAEASEQQLAPARAAVDIYRGDLMHADKVLNATNSSTGEYAPELLYLRGLWYLRQDNPREAIRRFSAAIQAAPQDIRMSLAQASALYAQNNHPMALKQLEDLEELAPRNVSSRLLQANINIESGRHPEGGEQMAREVLETLSSEASPGQLGWAKLLRARYFYISKNKLQARELVLDARSSRPVRDPEFSALTARTLLDLGDPEGAREEAKRAVELSPHLGRYRLLLAEALLEVGDYSAAEEHLRPVTNSPKAALLQGRIYLAREDLAGAERRFEEAAAGEREAPQAKLFLSEIYLRQNRTKQAIQVLEKLAEGPPALPEARILLGEAYLDTNQLDQAEKVLEQAQGELPNDPRVSIGLGKVFARKGQQERAIQAVQKALNIDPEQPDALATLGQLQLSMGNREEATQSFDKALELRPTHGDALIGRARVATAEREFASAAEYLQKAEGKVPSGYLELAKGELELRRYQPAKAVEHLEKAVEALPRERIAYALLGDANVLRGDSSSLRRARSAYAKALEIQSNDPRSLIGLAEIAIVGTSISRTTRAIEKAAEAIEGADVTATLAARMQTLKGRFEFEINGDASAARAPLERALELDANLAEAHLSFAFVADEQSRSSEACEHFRRYLELFENGQSQDVSDARSGVSKNCR